jgi:hypothetical protein
LQEWTPQSDRAWTAEPTDSGVAGEAIAAQDSDGGAVAAQAPASPVHDATAETDAQTDVDDPSLSEQEGGTPATASRPPQDGEAQTADAPPVADTAVGPCADAVDASPNVDSSDLDSTADVPPPASGLPRRRRPHGHDHPSDPTQPPTPITPGSRSGR